MKNKEQPDKDNRGRAVAREADPNPNPVDLDTQIRNLTLNEASQLVQLIEATFGSERDAIDYRDEEEPVDTRGELRILLASVNRAVSAALVRMNGVQEAIEAEKNATRQILARLATRT